MIERSSDSTLTDTFPLVSMPKHIAIVMDGNGRWAQNKGLERLKGHFQGAEALKRVIKNCHELEIQYLTLYAFSTENWQRPEAEVSGLINLLEKYLKSNLKEISKNNIRLRFIGDYSVLEPKLVALLNQAIASSAMNTGLQLTIAFNYGGRAEIARAAQKIAYRVQQNILAPQDITEELFAQELYTHDLPDPDLFIRTSNESRISNFLLWQIAYTELVIIDTFWPDFTKEDLIEAIKEYQSRDRRHGKIFSL